MGDTEDEDEGQQVEEAGEKLMGEAEDEDEGWDAWNGDAGGLGCV